MQNISILHWNNKTTEKLLEHNLNFENIVNYNAKECVTLDLNMYRDKIYLDVTFTKLGDVFDNPNDSSR